MKKVAVMQPYLFPYIGYFQLIKAVDIFVLYDDVNYINRGWINRNRILLNGEPHLFTIPLSKASQNKLINEIEIQDNQEAKIKLLKLIQHAYSKAPYFDDVYLLIENILNYQEKNLSRFIENSIKKISEYIGISTAIMISSKLKKNNALKGQEKIINICKILGSDCYINPIGGVHLYDENQFSDENIVLKFIKPKEIHYRQFKLNQHIPNLSIIDVLMFNSKSDISNFILHYQLIDKKTGVAKR